MRTEHFWLYLSRRCITYTMQGLSFREYLRMFYQKNFRKRTLQEILTDGNSLCAEVNAQLRPLPLFSEYLRYGYYPFQKEGRNNYYVRIENIVNTIVEAELPQMRKLDVGNIRKVKSLLGILSSGVPYTVDTVKLSSMAEMSRNTLLQYLQNLSEARLIQLLYSDAANIKRLQKPDKIYMENTNMLHALTTTQVNEGTEREVFFINQLSAAANRNGHMDTPLYKENYALLQKEINEIKGLIQDPIELKEEYPCR